MNADLVSSSNHGALSAELISGLLDHPIFLNGVQRFIETRIADAVKRGPTELPRLLSAREVRTFLGVCPATLDKLVSSGQLPCARIGGQRRFLLERVNAYVAANTARL